MKRHKHSGGMFVYPLSLENIGFVYFSVWHFLDMMVGGFPLHTPVSLRPLVFLFQSIDKQQTNRLNRKQADRSINL